MRNPRVQISLIFCLSKQLVAIPRFKSKKLSASGRRGWKRFNLQNQLQKLVLAYLNVHKYHAAWEKLGKVMFIYYYYTLKSSESNTPSPTGDTPNAFLLFPRILNTAVKNPGPLSRLPFTKSSMPSSTAFADVGGV
jgi:hypothetical protein